MKFEDINLCDLSQFERGCPHEVFAFLRKEAPVWFHPDTPLAPDGEGFWVISKIGDAREVLKNHAVFSSETGHGARAGGGTTLIDMSPDMAPGVVLSMMDPPKHDDIRGLVSQGFFPRTLQALEGEVRILMRNILKKVEGKQDIDFLHEVAAELPLQVICTMAGLPREDWYRMLDWAEAAIEFAAFDPNSDTEALVARLTDMGVYAWGHIQKLRGQEPDNTVMSQVVHATIPGVDGKPRALDDLELIRFFNLLITGGTETTRNALAGGYHALLAHSEQHRLLASNVEKYLPGAVEEILRYTSPVHFNRRTASADIEFGGKTIRRGDKVTVWYSSANYDEDIFTDARKFDIQRPNSNKHIAFGAGIHHCIGASLARMEIRILLEEMLKMTEGKTVVPVGDLRFIRSNRHQGVAEMNILIV